jgi:hypothetical protein
MRFLEVTIIILQYMERARNCRRTAPGTLHIPRGNSKISSILTEIPYFHKLHVKKLGKITKNI